MPRYGGGSSFGVGSAAGSAGCRVALWSSAQRFLTARPRGPCVALRPNRCPLKLRLLNLDDLAFYRRIYSDPAMWTELGGVPEVDFPAKLERDVAAVEADRHWVLV